MAVDVTMRFRAPQNTRVCAVPMPANCTIEYQRKYPAILTATFVTSVLDITGDDAPIQENSYLTVQENGEYLFRGKVRTLAFSRTEGQAVVTITALDKLQVINETLAVLETCPRRTIDSIDTGAGEVVFSGSDLTSFYTPGRGCFISYNGANDGTYTVVSSSFSGGDTTVVLAETLPSSTAGGYIMLLPQRVFHRYTQSLAISSATLYPADYYEGGFRDVWWPGAATTDAWLSDDAALASTIGEAMASSGDLDSLKLATTYQGGFLGAQWAKVGSEWIQFNGYRYDNSTGYWTIYDVKRAKLGTSAAAHLSGATIYPKYGKQIHFDTRVKIEGNTGAAWELISGQDVFEVNEDDGSFNFNQDPLGLNDAGSYTQIRATYAVYDEEDSSALTAGNCILPLLVSNPAAPSFGAGWTSGYTDSCTVDMTDMPVIKVNTFNVSKEMLIGDVIVKLLDEVGLNKGDDNDLISWKYRASDDKAVFAGVAQKALPTAADRYYADETRLDTTSTIEPVRSAVIAAFTQGEATNLLASRRMWNTPAQPNLGGGPPWAYTYTYGSVALANPAVFPGTYNISQTPVTGYTSLNRLTDNNDGTGIGVFDDTEPSPGFGWYGWFPGDDDTHPDEYYIDRVILTFDVTGVSDATTPYGWHVEAFSEFTGSTSTTPPTAGTGIQLGTLAQYHTPGPLNLGSVTVEYTPDFPVLARAIGIYFEGYLLRSDLANRYGWILKDAFVSGVRRRSTDSHIAAAARLNDTGALVGADTAAKLLDSTMGQHRVQIMETGPATLPTAQGLATVQHIGTLLLKDTREYGLEAQSVEQSGLPLPDLTVQMSDGWRGVVDYMRLTYSGYHRAVDFRATNYRSNVFGSAI